MSRHLKLVAVVAVVLVAVSGFSPNRKGGGSRSSGGGCSSSSSSSHSSSYDSDSDFTSGTTGTPGATGSSYGSDDDYGTSSGSSGYRGGSRHYHTSTGTTGARNSTGSASATVKKCVEGGAGDARSIVEVRNPKRYSKTYTVKVEFLHTDGSPVDSGTAEVEVGSRSTATVDVPMAHPERMLNAHKCRAELVG